MLTTELNLKPIRTMGIFLACGVLIAGCASNGVELHKQADSKITTSLPNKNQANANPDASAEKTSSATTTDTGHLKISDQAIITQPDKAGSDLSDQSQQATGKNISATQEPTQTTFYFGLNQAQLNAKDKAILAQHARFLKANPTLVLEINGHTDSSGSHAYNEYLSKRRAEAVAAILIKDGIKHSQLVINAMADKKPSSNQSINAKNRRVDIRYDDGNLVSSK